MLFGLVPLLIIGIWLEGNPFHLHWTPKAVGSLAYLVVVGSVIAFGLYYWLVSHMDVTKTMLIALVTPVVAVILGMLTLHEKLNWRLLAGGACIISSLGFIVWRGRRGGARKTLSDELNAEIVEL
jgi:drug/metabolite transporter (DMT)-like permease